LVVPAHEPLRESAANLESAVREGVSLEQASTGPARLNTTALGIGLDPRVQLDSEFAAVPIGTATPQTSLESLAADQSDNFVVRADVPDEMIQDGFVNGQPIFNDPEIAPFPVVCGSNAAVGNVAAVRALHKVAAVHARGHKGNRVAVAIMDTGISSAHLLSKGIQGRVDTSLVWNSLTAIGAAGQIVPPGGHAKGHGTMCAFDTLIAAPEARLLDYPILHGVGIAAGSAGAGTLSDALQAYAHLEAFWLVVFGPSRANYDVLVINNSWGLYRPSWDFAPGHPGRYIDNPNHPFNIKVSVMARHGIDIVFAAGNCGSQCPSTKCGGNVTHSIMGANAHPDVLTLAGTSTNRDRIGYSSEGPPIPNMGAPQKPDVACATHFAGSDALGPGVPDNGTSASCPVASGCVAALRTALSQTAFRPSQIFDALRTTAAQPPGTPGGWNAKFGHGIVDLDAAAHHLGV
jgi:hypothetical protein